MKSVIYRNVPPPPEWFAWLESLGRPYEDLQADKAYFGDHFDELKVQYPDRWVAIFNLEVIVDAATSLEIFEKLDQRGIPRAAAAVDFVEFTPLNWIL